MENKKHQEAVGNQDKPQAAPIQRRESQNEFHLPQRPFRQLAKQSLCSPRSLTVQQNSQEQSPADSAMEFLERRRSNDAATISQRRHSYYSQIQPDLYRRRGSIISIASSLSSTQSISPTILANGATSCVEKRRSPRVCTKIIGRAQLQLSYDFSKSDFIVQLIEASIQPRLPQVEEYRVQFLLSPLDDKDCSVKKHSTMIREIQKDGRVVATSESIKFAMSYEELLQQILTMEMISAQKRPASSPTLVYHAKASVEISLLNPSNDELLIWLDLESVKQDENTCGELNLCLQFLPSAARLTMTVHQATNLPARADGLPNTFVRASLIQDNKVILKKRKTNIRKGTISPSWNEVLTFEIDQSSIARCRLEVCVMDCDRFGNNSRPVGRINFSSMKQQLPACSVGNISAVHLWRETIQGRNVLLPQWMPLEPVTAASALALNMVA